MKSEIVLPPFASEGRITELAIPVHYIHFEDIEVCSMDDLSITKGTKC
jgi:hypothetical protein